ncbi:MAG: hypothetical protein JHC93_05820 [Parachlamydiales bacterium]|nr:hypothetical protein [Parachlamydiales bacterium]
MSIQPNCTYPQFYTENLRPADSILRTQINAELALLKGVIDDFKSLDDKTKALEIRHNRFLKSMGHANEAELTILKGVIDDFECLDDETKALEIWHNRFLKSMRHANEFGLVDEQQCVTDAVELLKCCLKHTVTKKIMTKQTFIGSDNLVYTEELLDLAPEDVTFELHLPIIAAIDWLEKRAGYQPSIGEQVSASVSTFFEQLNATDLRLQEHMEAIFNDQQNHLNGLLENLDDSFTNQASAEQRAFDALSIKIDSLNREIEGLGHTLAQMDQEIANTTHRVSSAELSAKQLDRDICALAEAKKNSEAGWCGALSGLLKVGISIAVSAAVSYGANYLLAGSNIAFAAETIPDGFKLGFKISSSAYTFAKEQ